MEMRNNKLDQPPFLKSSDEVIPGASPCPLNMIESWKAPGLFSVVSLNNTDPFIVRNQADVFLQFLVNKVQFFLHH